MRGVTLHFDEVVNHLYGRCLAAARWSPINLLGQHEFIARNQERDFQLRQPFEILSSLASTQGRQLSQLLPPNGDLVNRMDGELPEIVD